MTMALARMTFWATMPTRPRLMAFRRLERIKPASLRAHFSSSSALNNDVSLDNDEGHLQSIYKAKILESGGLYKQDEHQLEALAALNRLYTELKDRQYAQHKQEEQAATTTNSISFWSVFASKPSIAVPMEKSFTRGVYLHGGVGCGKTFCMNLFYDQVDFMDKQQVHFHKFMLNIHQEMHLGRKAGRGGDEVWQHVIDSTLGNGRLLCLDEFQVTDVADAMILSRLFTALMERGAILVATSNRPPQDLYLGGLQRDLFLPFIDFLEEHCQVVDMWDSTTDYRLLQERSNKGVYFVGKRDARKSFDALFHNLVHGANVRPISLFIGKRQVPIARASLKRGVARFTFEELCTKALGAADYLAIGQTFHTVFIEKIPRLSRNEVNWVRRLIVFVDSMYECHVKLVLHAAALPEDLFVVDLEDQATDEVFAFDRTRSRLEEMQSTQYLSAQWKGGGDKQQQQQQQQVTVESLRLEPTWSEDMLVTEERAVEDNGGRGEEEPTPQQQPRQVLDS